VIRVLLADDEAMMRAGCRAAQRRPQAAVIMLTTFGEGEYIAGALDSGVSGFLLKSGDPYELIAAVRAGHDGASYLSPKVAHRSPSRSAVVGWPCVRRSRSVSTG
jgi:DNA-binding response OmpR family regulator